jgi:hypothetical protein
LTAEPVLASDEAFASGCDRRNHHSAAAVINAIRITYTDDVIQ